MNFPRRQMQSSSRGWPHGPPSLLALLIIANVACFLAQSLADRFIAPGLAAHYFALSAAGLRAGYFWQPVTHLFLHGNAWHLLANMLALYFAGRGIESILGRAHLLGIYLAGGLAGAVAHLLFSPAGASVLGASGAIAALIVAYATILPELEFTLLVFFVIPVRMRLKYLAAGIVVLSLLFIVTGAAPGISHLAHLGGALIGWVYVQRLGYGTPLRVQRYFMEKKSRAARRERLTPAQFINQEIDPILDKISREGMQSLTRAERRILEKGREKIAQKTTRR